MDASNQVQGGRYSNMLKLAMKLGIQGTLLTSIDGSLAYEMRRIAKSASKSMVT